MSQMRYSMPEPHKPTHRFAIGDSVALKSRIGVAIKPDVTFRVIATLPPRDGSLQYRIRNETEKHERVAPEDNLEAAEAAGEPAAPAAAI